MGWYRQLQHFCSLNVLKDNGLFLGLTHLAEMCCLTTYSASVVKSFATR
uniref:Uncharacterized protein n=1 Tax=Anguilla anguilla TaxID=7936 RepID=A0A0E9RJ79_ANGAN